MTDSTATPIKDQRLRRGWTQENLAQQCWDEGAPVSADHLSKVERGLCMPEPNLRATLARILGLDIDLQKVEAKS